MFDLNAEVTSRENLLVCRQLGAFHESRPFGTICFSAIVAAKVRLALKMCGKKKLCFSFELSCTLIILVFNTPKQLLIVSTILFNHNIDFQCVFGAAPIAKGTFMYSMNVLDEKCPGNFKVRAVQTPPPHKAGRTSHSSDGGDIYGTIPEKGEHIHKCSGDS